MMFRPEPKPIIATGSAEPVRYIERFPQNRDRLQGVMAKLGESNTIHPEAVALTQEGLNGVATIAADASVSLFYDETIPEPEKKTHLRSSWHILDGELYLLVRNQLHQSYCLGLVPESQWVERLAGFDEHTGNG